MRKKLAVLALLVGFGVLATACGTTAPNFVFGTITNADGPVPQQFVVANDAMTARGRMASFSVPTSSALGIARINAFIPDHWLSSPTDYLLPWLGLSGGLFGFGASQLQISGIGDNRSFESGSDAFASRAAIELNFATGQGRVFMNDSCVDVHLAMFGPGSSPSQTFCRDALQLSNAIGDSNSNGFRTSVTYGAGGRFDLYILLSLKNGFSNIGGIPAPAPYNCAIDVGFHVWPDQGNLRMETWEPFGAPVDTFPALEGYWYDGLGDGAQTVLQRPADSRGVDALCDHEYHG